MQDCLTTPTPLALVANTLSSRAHRLLQSAQPGFVHVSVPLDVGLNGNRAANANFALSWLAANASQRRVFWSSRPSPGTESEITAGVGVADQIADGGSVPGGNSLIRRLAEAPRDTRYYGGLRFDMEMEMAPEWAPFGRFDFVLPRFEIRLGDEGPVVVMNLGPVDWERPDMIDRAVRETTFESESPGSIRAPVFRDNQPDLDGWSENITWALERFSTSRLGKVVLARRAILGFEQPVSPTGLMQQLASSTTNCYHFMFAPTQSRAFVGASPERLFKLQDRRVWSEAVAGTRRRGETEGADEELCKELLMSEKDQREHVYVRQSIKETLSALCAELHVDASASEMRLRRGRHLVSRVEGIAAADVSAADLLLGLHPTPAVGGYPTPDAMRAISQLEGFDRGWYAAPVGWISRDAAEFAVAIRSGLVEGKQVSLYSGAGIVGGSTAASEWAEIEDKLADFVSVFDADGSRSH